jgi:Uncharacterized conserved protein
MKVLYLDCTSGISGDMTLAALLDLGVDKEFFLTELKKLNVDGYEIIIQKKERHSILMMDVDVKLTEAAYEFDHGVQYHHEHEHTHENGCNHHNNGHDHTHNHCHSHDHGHGIHANERNLEMISEIIDRSEIADKAKAISKKIFNEIAAAEAKVHGKKINEVHFHEVGAIDSIVDIVGVGICIAALDPDVIYASPLHDGTGFIQCRHGLLPVPVPAVMAMLENSGIPMIQDDVNTEMITPTGMGIVKCMAEKYMRLPAMTIERIGYGLGKRETGRFGAVRAFLGSQIEDPEVD